MSHPAASVKSIFSGKINLDSPDDFYMEGEDSTGNGSDIEDDGDNQGEERYTGYEYVDDISSKDSNYSVTSKNLEAFDNQRIKLNDTNGTNLSLVSTESDYQQNIISETASELLGPEYLAIDTPSRPLSRNSTTSCLSTTATKDGIEGRRLHRHGPTAYSSNIIANMIHTQQLQSIAKSRLAKEINEISLEEPGTSSGDEIMSSSADIDIDTSQSKIRKHLKHHVKHPLHRDQAEHKEDMSSESEPK